MNIAEILKDAPKGTKLYSPVCGELTFIEVDEEIEDPITTVDKDGDEIDFACDGRFSRAFTDGECMLFPSKENRDWTTFKIESQFPGTIGECWRVENKAFSDNDEALAAWNRKITQFRTLLTCRNAWWYTDNDWQPNWYDGEIKFMILTINDQICTNDNTTANRILAFRTEKIRDSFLDTFKDLIEECKELL